MYVFFLLILTIIMLEVKYSKHNIYETEKISAGPISLSCKRTLVKPLFT